MCFIENNGRRILNKCILPVRHGEKGLFYPFSKHDPYYLSKFTLNLNGCFIYSSTTNCGKNMCNMKYHTGAMDALYREINIHKPHTDRQNKQIWSIYLCRQGKCWNSKYKCCKKCENLLYYILHFDTCYTFVWTVLHAEQ